MFLLALVFSVFFVHFFKWFIVFISISFVQFFLLACGVFCGISNMFLLALVFFVSFVHFFLLASDVLCGFSNMFLLALVFSVSFVHFFNWFLVLISISFVQNFVIGFWCSLWLF